MEDREIYELRQLCTAAGLTQEALGKLIDAQLSVPDLVKSEARAMASSKDAGLNMVERQKLREALRRHKDEVLSSVEPRIVEIGDDAEAHHIVAAQLQLAKQRALARAKAQAEVSRGEEAVKNGNVLGKYRWTQELAELTICVELPPGTAKKDVVCKIGMQSIVLGLRGEPPVVDGTLYARVSVDSAMWQLQDSHRLIVNVKKLVIDKQEWWPCLVQGEPEIDTRECEAGESTNLYTTNGERRFRIQKLELPESKDAKKYSPELAEKMWKDFFTKFPDWGAYEITLDANKKNADGTEKTVEDQLVETLGNTFDKSSGDWHKAND
uniref:CS domain-containing protein n=1 Tax=Calcidiscus leptoporus TaxID=127549 RepID=A0A7S0P394_9EUKA|mmetsp:Transcript_54712/g.126000  ORF Transcript_54712/g.126000 Transcript_54712/m.126000 type:complete len:324 (+) Transcript_54712:237-1208(+)